MACETNLSGTALPSSHLLWLALAGRLCSALAVLSLRQQPLASWEPGGGPGAPGCCPSPGAASDSGATNADSQAASPDSRWGAGAAAAAGPARVTRTCLRGPHLLLTESSLDRGPVLHLLGKPTVAGASQMLLLHGGSNAYRSRLLVLQHVSEALDVGGKRRRE